MTTLVAPIAATRRGSRTISRLPHVQRPDQDLVEALAVGDQRAMVEIVDRHGPSVLSMAAQICGHTHAHDVLQDVTMRLWTQPGRFDAQRGSLRRYLITMAKGRAIDTVRSEEKRHARERRVPADRSRTEHRLTAPSDDTHMWSLLADLAPGQREAIFLAFHQGHTYQDVARILELPEGTVKGRIRSGLTELHRLLDPTRISSEADE